MEGDGGGRRKESGAEERMRLQTDSSTPSSAHTRAQQRHAQALELEKQLRALIQSKGSADPNVRGLRNAIREAYEFVLLEDHAFAEANEVEPALWRLHYKRIEEFRARLRKGVQAAAAAATVPAIPMPGARVTPRRDVTLKVLAVYKSFLAEATGFYHELIKKLLAKHGMSQDYPSFSREPGVPDSEERMAEVHRVKQSWHRCLIFLGDLARYKEQNTEQEQRLKDWSVAAGYYLEAAALSPGSGNPHNQLAVLATYVGDELLAVYRYFRSLLVEIPFLTARDNLILLFEKNRQTYSQLPPQDSRMSLVLLDAPKSDKGKELKGDRMLSLGDGPLKLAVKDRKQDGADVNASLANIAEIRKSFRVRFVRLHGILFTKTSLETFSEVYAATVRDMEQLLCPDDTGLEVGLGSDHRSGIGTGSAGAAGVLQLTAILIFTVHNVNWGPENHHPTYAEILQRSALYKHAFTAAFECAGRLMRRCGDSKDPSESPLLPAMLVFMEWLACRPEMAEGSDVDEKQANARSFFWRQCVSLLNNLSASGKSGIDADSCLEGGLISGGVGDDESEVGVALWEDFELRGFTPLAPAQLALDYRKRPPRAGLGDRKERQIRTRRILAAGKAVAALLDGRGKGICFDKDLGRFFMAGELPVKTVKEATETPDIDANGVPLPVQNDMNGLSQALHAVKVTEAWTNGLPVEGHKPNVLEGVAGGMDGEEDEEVIVFKPMSRQSVSSVAMDSWVENPKLGANDGFAAQSSAGLGNGHGSSLALEDQVAGASVSASVHAPVLHAGDTSVPVSEAAKNAVISTTIHAHQNNQLNGILTASSAAMISSNLPVTVGSLSSAINLPSQEMNATMTSAPFAPTVGGGADWLIGRDGYPSFASWNMQTPRSMLDGVSADKLSGAGVIGQHKLGSVPSSWSQELEALASGYRYKNVRYGMESGISGVHSLTSDVPVHSSAAGSRGSSGAPSISLPFSSGPYSNAQAASVPYSNAQAVAKSDTVKSFQNGGIMPTYGSQGFPGSSKPSAQQYLEPEVRKSNFSEATNFANPSPAGLLPASVRSSSTSSNTWTNSKETPSASWVGPSGIRPPPGFGPRPTKPLNSNALETQPALTKPRAPVPVHEGEEQQQVDDYRWLDDFSGIRPNASSQAFQRQTSLYSSDYGIWPSESASRTEAAAAYPFPGTVTAQRRQSAPVYPYESAPGTYEGKSLQQQQQLQQQLLQRQHLYDSQKNFAAEQHYQQQVHYEAAQQQHQHQLLVQQQQQQQQQQLEHQKQQMWYAQYHSGDPFVS